MISIIIPTYNSAKILIQCLDSILLQTYKDYEIIVINDGSTDATKKILTEYSQKDSRLHFINTNNEGVSSARNKGIEIAKGEYIAFCDSDDIVCPNWLNDFIKDNINADLISQGYKNKNGDSIYLKKRLYNGKTHIKQWIYEAAKHRLWGFLWCKLFKTDIIKKYNLRFDANLKFQEDLVFILNYILYAKSIYQLSSSHYIYNDENDNKYTTVPKFYSSLKCIDFLRYIYENEKEELKEFEIYFQRMMIQDIITDYRINRNKNLQKDKYITLKKYFPKGIKRKDMIGVTRYLYAMSINYLPFPIYNLSMKFLTFFIKH